MPDELLLGDRSTRYPGGLLWLDRHPYWGSSQSPPPEKQVESFFDPIAINWRLASADGPIKTFSLRGIKESPPYLHDGRLLTLEDSIEFFNLVLETQLTEAEKADLLEFLRAL